MLDDILWALQPEAAQNIFTTLAGQLTFAASAQPAQGGGVTVPAVALGNFSPVAEDERGYSLRQGVAVIPITGTITRTSFYGWTQGQDSIAAALDNALANRFVRAVLFNVNSPGGVVSGTKELADKIRLASRQKLMAAYADGLMASAAFWLSAATGRIFAPVTATLGSIGVLSRHVDWSKYNERFGVAFTYITAGRLKAAGNSDNPISKEAAAMFQKQADEIHAIFKADVSSALGLTAPESDWAEGQTMLAAEAQALGLVSQTVQDLESAINLLSKEISMDYATLATQHPELLAQIQNEARVEAQKEAQAAAAKQTETVLALAGHVAGPEAQATLQGLLEAQVTPEQLAAMSKVFAAPAKAESTAQSEQPAPAAAQADKKDAILDALQKATPGALGGAVPPATKAKSPLVADAERRAAQAQTSRY